jgi:hypothetical protein
MLVEQCGKESIDATERKPGRDHSSEGLSVWTGSLGQQVTGRKRGRGWSRTAEDSGEVKLRAVMAIVVASAA